MSRTEKRTFSSIAVVIALILIFCARFAVMAKMPTSNTTREGGSYYVVDPLVRGDPDSDGEITVADALIALRIAARLAPETPEMIESCDTDGDGEITVADALAILRVAAKLTDVL